jgi:SAM-dependent methyltransferase
METQKRRQVEYHEKEHYRISEPRAIDNSHPYVAWLNNCRLNKAAQMMHVSLEGKTILTVCGGDGQEADFFQRLGARVTVIDLSTVALQAARLRNPALECICMDAESLNFADGSFDWAIVRDGLHHLARPLKGFYELERVSREGFAILEAQDSIPIRLLSVLGIAENWDPAGGYVYRFTRREIRKLFSSMQSVPECQIHTAWLPFGSDVLALFPAFRRFVYPAMQHPLILSFLASRPVKAAFKSAYGIFAFVAGHWGNSLIVVAHKGRAVTATNPAQS